MDNSAKRKGFTFVEVLVATLIISTMVVAGISSDTVLRYHLREKMGNKYTAINLASFQIDDLKARGYEDAELSAGIDKPCTLEALDMPAGFYTTNISYTVQDMTDWVEDDVEGVDPGGAEYKIITVTATYTTGNIETTGFVVDWE